MKKIDGDSGSISNNPAAKHEAYHKLTIDNEYIQITRKYIKDKNEAMEEAKLGKIDMKTAHNMFAAIHMKAMEKFGKFEQDVFNPPA